MKDARHLGRRPVLLVPLPSRVGWNLTATRRCSTTTPANPSDGGSGYCAPPASRQLAGNQHGNTNEERREGGNTPQKDKQGQGWVGETCASALTRRSGLLALWPLGSGTGSCLLFTDTEPPVDLHLARMGGLCA